MEIIAEYIREVVELGPAKVIYDSVLWLFLIVRFVPFLRGVRNDLTRNIYLGILLSAIYASSVGGAIDIWVGEYDSEFRILFGVISTYFFLLITFSLWNKLGTGEYINSRFSKPSDLLRINVIWLLISIVSFFMLEFYLGRPTIYALHTESFDIEGNVCLGVGRILTRSYAIFATLLFSLAMYRLSITTFVNDARFRLRAWAAIVTISLVGLHYFNISLATLVVLISQDLVGYVEKIYMGIAFVVVIISALSIALLSSPRRVLDGIIRIRYRVRAKFLFKKITWLHTHLSNTLNDAPESFPSFEFPTNGALSYRMSKVILNITDMRICMSRYLSQEEFEEFFSRERDKSRNPFSSTYNDILSEALILELSSERVRLGFTELQGSWVESIGDINIGSQERLMEFYAQVSDLIKQRHKLKGAA